MTKKACNHLKKKFVVFVVYYNKRMCISHFHRTLFNPKVKSAIAYMHYVIQYRQ